MPITLEIAADRKTKIKTFSGFLDKESIVTVVSPTMVVMPINNSIKATTLIIFLVIILNRPLLSNHQLEAALFISKQAEMISPQPRQTDSHKAS
jgi:hypothetical protein